MLRRDVLRLGGAISAAAMFERAFDCALAAAPDPNASLRLGQSTPFRDGAVKDRARLLSKSPYQPPEDTIPLAYKNLDYDKYRAIRFKKDLALWQGDGLGYTAEFFSAGYIYNTPVRISVVEGEQASEVLYAPGLFTYGPEVSPPPDGSKPGFSGFRLHAPVDRPGQMDEFAVFQGASYFRAKAAGQGYGLSARGLAIDTAQPPADEFPIFREYWLVKPAKGTQSVTVFALLDSKSVSGAYKFVISAGYNTIIEAECTLFPRNVMPYAGIAPLTSMFYFTPSSGFHADDARFSVHDSDGLLIVNGNGEHIWRPLVNPKEVQFSAFADSSVKGFGLIQRERRPDLYQDFDARYEARPSIWVEPVDPWGEGTVDLVELPTGTEYFDNIVAFWHPKEPLRPGVEYHYRYRLTWCKEPPAGHGIASIAQTLTGASSKDRLARQFYVDFAGTEDFNLCDDFDAFCQDKNENLELSASAGHFSNVAMRRNPISGGHRAGFEYYPAPGINQADLRCALAVKGKLVSEVWLYRWAA
jgi:glucans biosynthesis protein